MNIKTNNNQRDLISYFELPEMVRPEFDYMAGREDEQYSNRFFKFRGSFYDAYEFQRVQIMGEDHHAQGFAIATESGSELSRWDGAQADSHFSGVVIKWGRDWAGELDTECVVVGTWSE
jgi:hypothetical protein